jgi:hypothetical protein
MRGVVFVIVVAVTCVGCASNRAPSADAQLAAFIPSTLSAPQDVVELDATVVPPIDWRADPMKLSDHHQHQTWISPSGSTAYGVIHFTLPLPVGEDIALHGFLGEMKKTEGEATLLSKNRDGEALRFVAEGGKYRIRGILRTRGFHGWAIYAGTLRGRDVAVDELELAVQARENTALGLGSD